MSEPPEEITASRAGFWEESVTTSIPRNLSDDELVAFPAHALLILEDWLRERQEAGELPAETDPTDFALRLLVAAELGSD